MMRTEPQRPGLVAAMNAIMTDRAVALRIVVPAILGSVLGGLFVIEGLGNPFPVWTILFTTFFYGRMAFAWHRFAMLGEMPRRDLPGDVLKLRRTYLWRVFFAVFIGIFATAVVTLYLSVGVFDTFDAAPAEPQATASRATAFAMERVTALTLMISAVCAVVLLIGPELPLRAAGVGAVNNKPMARSAIMAGSLLFSPIGLLNAFSRPREPEKNILKAIGLVDGIGKPLPAAEVFRGTLTLGAAGAAGILAIEALTGLLGRLPDVGEALGGDTAHMVLMQGFFGFGTLILASLLALHAKDDPAAPRRTGVPAPQQTPRPWRSTAMTPPADEAASLRGIFR